MSSVLGVFLMLSEFAVSMLAQDATGFPFAGNRTGATSRMESAPRPEAATPPEYFARPTAVVPVDHLLPAPQRMYIRHRSDSVPYVYEHPHFGYPVAHSIDYPVAPSSKHLVIVSFIGLLLLFAVIQNTIATVKRRELMTDVLSVRRRRDLYPVHDFRSEESLRTPEEEDVLNEDARVRCIQRTVCLENRRLSRMFGGTGKVLAKYLTRGVERSVKTSSGWDRLVRDAGEAGIRGEDCGQIYRDCDDEISSRDSRRTGEEDSVSGNRNRASRRREKS